MNRSELIKSASKKLDGLLPFDKYGELLAESLNALLGGVIKFTAKQIEKRDDEIIEFAFNKIYSLIPEAGKDALDQALLAYVSNDVMALQGIGVESIVKSVDTPFGDEMERVFITGQIRVFLECLKVNMK